MTPEQAKTTLKAGDRVWADSDCGTVARVTPDGAEVHWDVVLPSGAVVVEGGARRFYRWEDSLPSCLKRHTLVLPTAAWSVRKRRTRNMSDTAATFVTGGTKMSNESRIVVHGPETDEAVQGLCWGSHSDRAQ
jgi:hypothetical protein